MQYIAMANENPKPFCVDEDRRRDPRERRAPSAGESLIHETNLVQDLVALLEPPHERPRRFASRARADWPLRSARSHATAE
jgi:hypothetical protein